jgi:hypothetical protein
MRVKTWRVLDYGVVPTDAPTIPYDCPCGREAELPIKGRVIAVTSDGGVIFDTRERAIPDKIQCRRCGRVLVRDSENVR